MNPENKKLLISCIRNNDYVKEPLIDVRKMMETESVGLFTNICINRIKAAGLVDGTHIIEDHTGISMDAEGIKKAKMILQGYVNPDALSDYEEACREFKDLTTYLNNILYILRRMDQKDLREMLQNIKTSNGSGKSEIDLDFIDMEIKQRRWWNKLLRFLRYLLAIGDAIIEVKLPIKAIPSYLKMVFPAIKTTKYQPRYCGEKYYQALKRFESRHKGQKRMSRDDQKQYIFLGIKAFGKEYMRLKGGSKSKSFYDIKWQYEQCHKIMEVIGQIKPRELMQMFPIDKKYVGNKWNEKDYFYTISKLPDLDEPIGTEQDVACIFWDYVNSDLDFFFINWMDSVDDLYIYCEEKEPRERWKSEMNKRYKVKEGD